MEKEILELIKTNDMSKFKKAKVIMLSAEVKSKILIVYTDVEKTSGKLVLNGIVNDNYKRYQNLYIISDDEIKEGDWCLDQDNNLFQKGNNGLSNNADYFGNMKKIIATTDTFLNELDRFNNKSWDDLLHQPSQQFIEKYIESYNKDEIITDVLVEYEVHKNSFVPLWIPKVNPKDNTIKIKKLKENWSREELMDLLENAYDSGRYAIIHKDVDQTFGRWVEENL